MFLTSLHTKVQNKGDGFLANNHSAAAVAVTRAVLMSSLLLGLYTLAGSPEGTSCQMEKTWGFERTPFQTYVHCAEHQALTPEH